MPFTVGQLAREFGLSPDALRYYERLGLLSPEGRTPAGYRLYGEEARRRLRFVKEAQAAGLRLEDIAGILRLMDEGKPPCRHVREVLGARLEEVRRRLRELRAWSRPWPSVWPLPRPTPTPPATGRTTASTWTPLTLERAPGSSLGAWRRTAFASGSPRSTAQGASARWSVPWARWRGWRR